jgi:hypothetical protein
MTRQKRLKEVLNVRLDVPLAQEIRRIATSRGTTESEVARDLLSYGANVARQLEADRLSESYESEYARLERRDDYWVVEIKARWREASLEEVQGEGGSVLPLDDAEDEPE